jgi:hypothetical protein
MTFSNLCERFESNLFLCKGREKVNFNVGIELQVNSFAIDVCSFINIVSRVTLDDRFSSLCPHCLQSVPKFSLCRMWS